MSRSNIGSDKPFVFTGTDELRSADVMHNYNRGITSIFKRGWERASRGDRVLDFGAGMGSITEEFYVRTGVRPIALESDKTLADLVRGRGYPVIDTLADVSPGTLDLVFSSNVLEHIKDDVALVRKIFSALRPGGIFALYVPAFPLLYTAYDRKTGASAGKRGRNSPPGLWPVAFCFWKIPTGTALALLPLSHTKCFEATASNLQHQGNFALTTGCIPFRICWTTLA